MTKAGISFPFEYTYSWLLQHFTIIITRKKEQSLLLLFAAWGTFDNLDKMVREGLQTGPAFEGKMPLPYSLHRGVWEFIYTWSLNAHLLSQRMLVWTLSRCDAVREKADTHWGRAFTLCLFLMLVSLLWLWKQWMHVKNIWR